jgi:hypothetical protein
MSVPKGKRSKSKVEFEMNYFKLADGLDNLVENYFWADLETIQQHKLFIRLRAEAIEKLTDELVFHIERRIKETARRDRIKTRRTVAGGKSQEDTHHQTDTWIHLVASEIYHPADRTHREDSKPRQDSARAQTIESIPQDARFRADE